MSFKLLQKAVMSQTVLDPSPDMLTYEEQPPTTLALYEKQAAMAPPPLVPTASADTWKARWKIGKNETTEADVPPDTLTPENEFALAQLSSIVNGSAVPMGAPPSSRKGSGSSQRRP